MKKDPLITINDEINKIYLTLDKIKKYDIDCNELLKKLESFEKSYSNIKQNSNINSSTQMQTYSEAKVQSLLASIYMLQAQINNLNSWMKIYDDVEMFESKYINDDMSVERLNNIVQTILSDLSNLAKIRTIDSNYDFNDEVYQKVYEIIKEEYRLKGKSELYDYILDGKFNHSLLNKYIDNDTKKYKLSSQELYLPGILSEVKNKDKEYQDAIEKYKLFIISITENDFKKKMLKQFKTICDNHAHYCEEQHNYFYTVFAHTASEKLNKIKEVKKDAFAISGYLLSFLASFGIVIGASALTIKKENSKAVYDTYMTTKSYYDEIDGSSTIKEYDIVNIGDITYKIYSPVEEDGTRTLKIYSTNDTSIKNAKEVLDYNLDDMTLISEKNVVDKDLNNSDKDEHISIKVATDVDYENTEKFDSRDTGFYFKVIGLEILIIGLWLVINHFFDEAVPTAKRLLYGDVFDELDYAFTKLRENISKLKEATYLHNSAKENNKCMLDKIDELEKEYDRLYEKYSYLKIILDNENCAVKLKRTI